MSIEKNKIALLILATSKQRDNWVSIKDSYLFNMTLKSFLSSQDKEHEYIFYIGIDKDDRIFDKVLLPEDSERGNLTLYINYLSSNTSNNSTRWMRCFKC